MNEKLHSLWPVLALEGVGDTIGDPRPCFVVSHDARFIHFANAAGARFLALDPAHAIDTRATIEPRLRERLVRFAAGAAPGDAGRELLRFFDGLRASLVSVAFHRPPGADDAILVTVDNARADPADVPVQASLAAIAAEGGLVALFDGDGEVLAAVGDHATLDGVQDDIEAVLDAEDGALLIERRVIAAGRAHDVALVRLGSGPQPRRLLRIGPAEAQATAAIGTFAPAADAPILQTASAPLAAPIVDDAAPIAPIAVIEAHQALPTLDGAPIAEAPAEPIVMAAPYPTMSPEDLAAAVDAAIEAEPRPLAEPAAAPTVESTETAAGETAAEPSAMTPSAPETTRAVAALPQGEPAAGASLPQPIVAAAAPIAEPAPAVAEASPMDESAPAAAAAAFATESAPARVADAAADATSPTLAAPAETRLTPLDTPTAGDVAESTPTSRFHFQPPRRSVKFVWQMDADRRFTLVSDELARVVGPRAAELVGRSWSEVASDLGLDPEGRVAGALDRRDTWSGRTVLWPIEGEALRLPVDLAALPAFDRGRIFTGFRGFGTVRGEETLPDPTATGLRLAARANGATTAPLDAAAAALPQAVIPAAEANEANEANEFATSTDGDTLAGVATLAALPLAALSTAAAEDGALQDGAVHHAAEPDAETPLVPVSDDPAAALVALDPATPSDAGETPDEIAAADEASAIVVDADPIAAVAPVVADDVPPQWPDDREIALLAMATQPAHLGEAGDGAFAGEIADLPATVVAPPATDEAEPAALTVDEPAAVATLTADEPPVAADHPIATPSDREPPTESPIVAPPVSPLALVAADVAAPRAVADETAATAGTPDAAETTVPAATAAFVADGDIAAPETDTAAPHVEADVTAPVPPHTDTAVPAVEATIAPHQAAPTAPAAAAGNVVALAAGLRPAADAVRLSPPERVAFRQIAEALGARLESEAAAKAAAAAATEKRDETPPPVAPTDAAPDGAGRAVDRVAVPPPAPESAKAPTPPAAVTPDTPDAAEPAPVATAPIEPTQPPAATQTRAAAPALADSTSPAARAPSASAGRSVETRLLDRLPTAVAVVKDDAVVYANQAFLDLLDYPDVAALEEEGGLDALFAGEHVARRYEAAADGGRPVPVLTRDGKVVPVDAVLATVPWASSSALMLTMTVVAATPLPEPDAAGDVAAATPLVAPTVGAPAPVPTPSASLSDTIDAAAGRERIAELEAIIDTATDGVLMLDGEGVILSANQAAEALFGTDRREMIGRPLTDRIAPESRRSAMDYLDGLARNGVASVLNDGREIIGVVERGGLIPLFMTIGRISPAPSRKYCAVLRDITHWKKSEEDLTAARRRAEEASVHKSDFLAKISHEIRTPLNAIIGFSEVMMDERFGAIGNDRYKDYLRDIHSSGSHIMSLINDLLDLSKVEAGKMDLRFEAVALGDIMSECVAMMQPQANRERIIIRSSLPATVPAVVADPRSVRQVVLNLLSNAIKFTPSGGQVIVSTTLEDSGEVVMRVRDTGYGMTDKELQTAMEPFRQLHTTRSRGGGTGLGLPLTKALVEANRAMFRIDSTVGQGTLVTVTFPVTRVLAS